MKRLVVFIALAIAGCAPQAASAPRIPLTEGSPEAIENMSHSRFKVHKEATFLDSLAYTGKRAIYILTDTETGKEYVGVSGIGISELGQHGSGDDTVRDER